MREIFDLISLSPDDLHLHKLADLVSSEVIGFAERRLREMADDTENEVLKKNSKRDMITFLAALSEDIEYEYIMRVKEFSRGKDEQDSKM